MKHNYTSSFQRDGEAINNLGHANYCHTIIDHICEPIVVTQSSTTLGGEIQLRTWTACSICGMPMGDALLKKINSTPKDKPGVAIDDDSSTESQKQILIDIMDEDQKDGLYDDITIPKELDDWAIATAMDSFQDAADKPIMDILLRGTFYRGECAAIKKLMPEIERLKKALQQIEQMSDPGDYEKAIVDMKSIASNALNFTSE